MDNGFLDSFISSTDEENKNSIKNNESQDLPPIKKNITNENIKAIVNEPIIDKSVKTMEVNDYNVYITVKQIASQLENDISEQTVRNYINDYIDFFDIMRGNNNQLRIAESDLDLFKEIYELRNTQKQSKVAVRNYLSQKYGKDTAAPNNSSNLPTPTYDNDLNVQFSQLEDKVKQVFTIGTKEINKKIDSVESKLNDANNKIGNLKNIIKDQKDEILRLNSVIKDNYHEIADNYKVIGNLKDEVIRANKEMLTMQEVISNILIKTEESQNSQNQITNEIKSQFGDQRKSLNNIQNNLKNTQNNNFETKFTELHNELNNNFDDIKNIILEKYSDNSSSDDDRLLELENTVADMSEKYAKATLVIKELQKELNNRKDKIIKLQEYIKDIVLNEAGSSNEDDGNDFNDNTPELNHDNDYRNEDEYDNSSENFRRKSKFSLFKK